VKSKERGRGRWETKHHKVKHQSPKPWNFKIPIKNFQISDIRNHQIVVSIWWEVGFQAEDHLELLTKLDSSLHSWLQLWGFATRATYLISFFFEALRGFYRFQRLDTPGRPKYPFCQRPTTNQRVTFHWCQRRPRPRLPERPQVHQSKGL